jgi:uncharacterized protein
MASWHMNTVIPHDLLRPDTLWALIEEFVTRDGAIQGHVELSLSAKMQDVQSRLQAGMALIVFNEADETFSIVAADEWQQSRRPFEQLEGDGIADQM